MRNTAKSDEIAHLYDLINLRTQYHKTVSWNCKRSVTLLQTNEENILPYTVKIDSARAVRCSLVTLRTLDLLIRPNCKIKHKQINTYNEMFG